MKILKLTFAAVAALLLTSCLTKVVLSTVLVDKKTVNVRAYGDAVVLNVKCAVSVKASTSDSWIHLSATSFGTNLGDGYDLVITTDAATAGSATVGNVRISIDSESYTDVKIEREARSDDEVYDAERNRYSVRKIGSYYWICDNIKSSKYDTRSEAYGLSLTEIENESGYTGRSYMDPSKVSALGTMSNYKERMGYLYNWVGAMGLTVSEGESVTSGEYGGKKRQGICPNGFHIPTKAEYENLESVSTGAKLKSDKGWSESVGNGTNALYFNGYPCGLYDSGVYKSVGMRTSYWASTSRSAELKYCMGIPQINTTDAIAIETGYLEKEGQSVRCVRNN
jgi:uncharacterized protein (TIGR02145 family)